MRDNGSLAECRRAWRARRSRESAIEDFWWGERKTRNPRRFTMVHPERCLNAKILQGQHRVSAAGATIVRGGEHRLPLDFATQERVLSRGGDLSAVGLRKIGGGYRGR